MLAIIAIFGILVFETGAVLVTKVQVDGVALKAAEEGAHEYYKTRSAKVAEAAAQAVAQEHEAEVTDFTVSEDGRMVEVTVVKRAHTIFLHKISSASDLVRSRSTHTGAVK